MRLHRARWHIPGEQARPLDGNRIEAPVTPGMATQHAARRQIGAGARTVRLERSQGIGRTGRLETALRADPGAEQQSVAAHQRDQHAARQVTNEARKRRHGTQRACCATGPTGPVRHRASKASISRRAALRRAAEAALANSARAKGARSRTTHRPDARGCMSASRRWAALRIWRLMRLRVAARRAWRLGTTAPSQTRGPGRAAESNAGRSSTAC